MIINIGIETLDEALHRIVSDELGGVPVQITTNAGNISIDVDEAGATIPQAKQDAIFSRIRGELEGRGMRGDVRRK